LDHEQHDMRETRETANAAMDQAIPHVAGDSASSQFDFVHLLDK
jgi:hypothetical protein